MLLCLYIIPVLTCKMIIITLFHQTIMYCIHIHHLPARQTLARAADPAVEVPGAYLIYMSISLHHFILFYILFFLSHQFVDVCVRHVSLVTSAVKLLFQIYVYMWLFYLSLQINWASFYYLVYKIWSLSFDSLTETPYPRSKPTGCHDITPNVHVHRI